MTSRERLDSAWWVLRIALGLGSCLAGLDKFFNFLTDWQIYLSLAAGRVLPIEGVTFMHVVGILELALGLTILTRWTRIGSYVAMAWLITVAADLIATGMFYDLAMRHLEIAVAAYALARLTEFREHPQNLDLPTSQWRTGYLPPNDASFSFQETVLEPKHHCAVRREPHRRM